MWNAKGREFEPRMNHFFLPIYNSLTQNAEWNVCFFFALAAGFLVKEHAGFKTIDTCSPEHNCDDPVEVHAFELRGAGRCDRPGLYRLRS
jgi:hypothetical protein